MSLLKKLVYTSTSLAAVYIWWLGLKKKEQETHQDQGQPVPGKYFGATIKPSLRGNRKHRREKTEWDTDESDKSLSRRGGMDEPGSDIKVKRQSQNQKFKKALAREANQQGLDPQSDIFEDTMNDRGQEVMDDIGAEEDMDDFGSTDKN